MFLSAVPCASVMRSWDWSLQGIDDHVEQPNASAGALSHVSKCLVLLWLETNHLGEKKEKL